VTGTLDVEAGPGAVGALVGVAGLLLLLEPVVGTVAVGGVRVRPVALSMDILAAGFCLGAVVFHRRGRRLFAIAHGSLGVACAGIALGGAVGSGEIVIGSVVALAAVCGFLVTQHRRRH